MAAGSIVVELLMKTGSFETDTGRAEKRLKEFKKEAVESGKAIGNALLAFTAAGAALTAFAKQAINSIDALNDVADATGASIENISALENVALRTGSSLQTVTSLLTKFNLVLKDGDPDKGPGAVLKSLNLDINALKKLDPAEALRQTAVALSGFADDGNKARAVQELFGRSVAEVAPLLKDLAAQSKLVATTTTQQTEEAEKFNKQLFELQTNLSQFGRSIVSDALPALNTMIDRFKEGNKQGEGFIKTLLRQTEIARLLGMGPKLTPKITFDPNDQSAAEMARLSRRQSLSVVESPDKPKGPRGPKPQDLFGDYLKSLQRQLEATQELTTVETLLRDVQLGRLGSVSSKQLESLKNIAGEIDASKQFAAIEKEFAKLEDESLKRKKDLAAAGQAVYEATRTPLERLNIEQAKLNELLKSGAINFDTFARASLDLDESLNKVAELSKGLDDFAKTAAENIQGAIGDGLVDVLDGNFKDIGNNFKRLLDRMAAEAVAARIARALFGGNAEGGTGQGVLGSALKYLGGFFGGPKAGGGDVMPGRSYLVGEEGPERFVPRTMGTIVPAAVTAGAGRAMSITNNFTVGENVDRRTQAQIAAAARRGLEIGERNL